jgi:hypothetical protein
MAVQDRLTCGDPDIGPNVEAGNAGVLGLQVMADGDHQIIDRDHLSPMQRKIVRRMSLWYDKFVSRRDRIEVRKDVREIIALLDFRGVQIAEGAAGLSVVHASMLLAGP